MYSTNIHNLLSSFMLPKSKISQDGYLDFTIRLSANIVEIKALFDNLYGQHTSSKEDFQRLLSVIFKAHYERSQALHMMDRQKLLEDKPWFLDNKIVGMSLYVDRFATNLLGVKDKLAYFDELGVNFLHLMPIMQSPVGESDGGYAVSDFRKVDPRFGTLEDLKLLISDMKDKGFYLMQDIVLNHTSYQHEWALKASAGDPIYQDYYYMYDSRQLPDQYEKAMPEIFPENSPGNFTFDQQSGKWVMTVFNHYQWDLNFTNPAVLIDMLDNIFFYANLGVDILRIDAPAFIWKKLGTDCQNLPEAHQVLQLLKLCVQSAAPGMALLGEAIVAPKEIMKYFGTGHYYGRECDIAYNATHMAVQWDALATGDTRILMGAQHDILQKPYGVTWINYTRCHDDIGLGYEDAAISKAGFDPYQHRNFIKNYYAGSYPGSSARGALFGVNEKNNDARISGTLASLCGLEAAIDSDDKSAISQSIDKIIMMQAMSILMGGIPMLFYGDELGVTNDYTYTTDPSKSYDNRWMHRLLIDWEKVKRRNIKNTIEQVIFTATQSIISLRKTDPIFSDLRNLQWLNLGSNHVAGFVRAIDNRKVFCIYNFSTVNAYVTWHSLIEYGQSEGTILTDKRTGHAYPVGNSSQYLQLTAYQWLVLEG